MLLYQLFKKIFLRFRYPVSLPEDVAEALGVTLSNGLSFQDFVDQLCKPSLNLTRLSRFMPRESAELAFQNAIRKERFTEKTLVSYYFSEGWMEFMLQFDNQSRLRRVYLLHKKIPSDQGVELPLLIYTI